MLTWISTFCSLAMPGAYQVHRLGKQPAEVLLSAPPTVCKAKGKRHPDRKGDHKSQAFSSGDA